MDIEIEQLRKVTNRLLDHLEQSGHSLVSVSRDYYWSIPEEARYDPYSQPSDLTIGQLSDDLAELMKIAGSETDPIAYALVWLSSILRAIGEEVVA